MDGSQFSSMLAPKSLILASTACLVLLMACDGEGDGSGQPETTPAPASPTSQDAIGDQAATPLPPIAPTAITRELLEIQATRLQIPALGIDTPVQLSEVLPFTGEVGCPPKYKEGVSLKTPDQGVATPSGIIEGAENKAWVFGHSRWAGQAGIFFRLQDINLNDEVIVDGIDRTTGESYNDLRFHVTQLFLADVDSGADLIEANSPDEVPARPLLVLQTSARENGVGKHWVLDREKVMSKATNLVQGDLEDPCRYLTLWIFAEPAWNVPQ